MKSRCNSIKNISARSNKSKKKHSVCNSKEICNSQTGEDGKKVNYENLKPSINIIEKLPTEILVNIANNLSIKELESLGSTCSLLMGVTSFIKKRRGPQSILLKLHLNYENRNCHLCYRQIFITFEKVRSFDKLSDFSFRLCDDLGPAECLMNDWLYCQPRCILIFATENIVAESRVGKTCNVLNFFDYQDLPKCQNPLSIKHLNSCDVKQTKLFFGYCFIFSMIIECSYAN